MKYNLGIRDLKDLDNISVTGYRIITILKMLLNKPCSDTDINERLKKDILGARDLSRDTICIYINTLRAIGCVISRPSKNTGYKYILKSHPFTLNFNEEEFNGLFNILKNISCFNDWNLMVDIDTLFKTIRDNLSPESRKLMGFATKPRFLNTDSKVEHKILHSLEKYCKEKRTILLKYLSPESGEKLVEVIADKISFENCALYLWCYNLELDETQYLRIDRIKDIKVVNLSKTNYKSKLCTIKYKLTGISGLTYVPAIDEKIIERTDKEIIIEAKVRNKFRYVQKILYYGSDCTLIDPETLKHEIIAKLESMLCIYNKPEA